MSDVILKKLEEHDAHFAFMYKKLEGHDAHFTHIYSKLEEHDEKFKQIDHRFDCIDARLFAHEEMFKTFATKDDLRDLRNEMMNSFDQILKILLDMQTEMAASNARLDRKSLLIDDHEERIINVELHLDLI